MVNEKIIECGDRLYDALRGSYTVSPLTETEGGLTIDDAYEISLRFLDRRLSDGEKVIGKKIGVTSKAVQDMLGVHQPDFGYLTDAMVVANNGDVRIAGTLIQPRAEGEIAFRLKSDLQGPGVDEAAVLAATQSIIPCFEIVDSRIQDWKIRIEDTIADNASCGVFVLGEAERDPQDFDLPSLKLRMFKNGDFLSEGLGSAVQGSPLTAVAWLANTLGGYGIPLKAGEVILSGSVVPLEPVSAGDELTLELEGVGGAAIRFS